MNRVAVVGTGNKISDGTSDVVIGDYHEMSGGTNNVILGAMATKEDVVSKTYTPSLGSSSGTPGGYTGRPIPYNVRATVPTKTHTANVSNAVMLGYNTDVQKNGGVALGSESVSSVDAGVYGYSPDTNQNIQNDTEIANLTGKTARLAELNGDLPGLSSAYTAKKADYEGKVNDFLEKSAAYTQAYQTYHSYEHSGDQYDLARKKKMDDAKIVMDTAQTAMNAAKTDYTDAETKYNSALGERNLIIGTWKATAAAVSVGDVSRGITRQMTGVAAGTQDTDAVNVAQLKTAKTHYYSVNDKGYHVGNYNNDGAKGGMALAAGAGAAANGTASTVTGAFSRVDGNGINGFTNGFQGATSSVYGTFNVVGAKSGVDFDGVANSIIGVANKTENANASLIFGAGNKVTNSYRPVNGFAAGPLSNALQKAISTGDTDDMINALSDLVKDSGGSVLSIGGANIADYAQLSRLVGVGNKLTGTDGHESKYNMIDGYLNIGKNINHVSVIGSENTVEDTDDALVLGNKRKLSGAGGSIILGSGDNPITTNVPDVVSIGHNANVTAAGGVALGSSSVASVDKGVIGYDASGTDHSNDATGTWKSTAAAVSVGKEATPTSAAVTRQITNVAAGTQDTDAVNVAQLKALENKTAAEAAKHTTVTAGDYVTVTETDNSGQKNYTVTGPKMESADGTVKITDKVENGKKVGYNLSVDTSKLGIKDMHVKEGTATYQADGIGSIELTHQDGQKATVTGLKDTRLKEGTGALTLSGNTLSMKIEDTSGKKVTGSVDLSAIAGQIDTNTTYTMSGTQNADNTTTITLKGSDGKENKVTVATKDTRNTVKAGENVTLDTAANTFGGTEYTVNVKADGKVENGSTKIVSGNTVYHETRVKNDGNYVKKENSAGDNLTILDKQVGKNTTNITNLGNTINNLNGKLGTLDNRISKVGAGAAALAALHPLDFDPHDKWDIAAGFGNYRNASAAAVGLFYRPNERTMMSLGWTMGDDRNMINAGISVKLGRGDVYTRYSKVEMANRIEAQNKRINDMESELEELKAQIAALAAKK